MLPAPWQRGATLEEDEMPKFSMHDHEYEISQEQLDRYQVALQSLVDYYGARWLDVLHTRWANGSDVYEAHGVILHQMRNNHFYYPQIWKRALPKVAKVDKALARIQAARVQRAFGLPASPRRI